MTLCIYNLCAFCALVTFLLWPLYSGSRIRNMHWVEGSVDYNAGLDADAPAGAWTRIPLTVQPAP